MLLETGMSNDHLFLLNLANETNLAVGQPTWQSSTENEATSDRAVDGNTDTGGRSSCSRTRIEGSPWWAVDLGGDFQITHIVVTALDDERFGMILVSILPSLCMT